MSDSESIPRWPAVCQLVRLPNVFTAMADVAMGYLFVTLGPPDWLLFLLLLAASSCLYMAGMVLNDLFDVEQDTRERPQRPIPSGAISLATAQQIGWGLLAGGLVLAGCASGVAMRSTDLWWRSGLIAILLAATIVLYDAVVKPTLAGPLAMDFAGC